MAKVNLNLDAKKKQKQSLVGDQGRISKPLSDINIQAGQAGFNVTPIATPESTTTVDTTPITTQIAPQVPQIQQEVAPDVEQKAPEQLLEEQVGRTSTEEVDTLGKTIEKDRKQVESDVDRLATPIESRIPNRLDLQRQKSDIRNNAVGKINTKIEKLKKDMKEDLDPARNIRRMQIIQKLGQERNGLIMAQEIENNRHKFDMESADIFESFSKILGGFQQEVETIAPEIEQEGEVVNTNTISPEALVMPTTEGEGFSVKAIPEAPVGEDIRTIDLRKETIKKELQLNKLDTKDANSVIRKFIREVNNEMRQKIKNNIYLKSMLSKIINNPALLDKNLNDILRDEMRSAKARLNNLLDGIEAMKNYAGGIYNIIAESNILRDNFNPNEVFSNFLELTGYNNIETFLLSARENTQLQNLYMIIAQFHMKLSIGTGKEITHLGDAIEFRRALAKFYIPGQKANEKGTRPMTYEERLAMNMYHSLNDAMKENFPEVRFLDEAYSDIEKDLQLLRVHLSLGKEGEEIYTPSKLKKLSDVDFVNLADKLELYVPGITAQMEAYYDFKKIMENYGKERSRTLIGRIFRGMTDVNNILFFGGLTMTIASSGVFAPFFALGIGIWAFQRHISARSFISSLNALTPHQDDQLSEMMQQLSAQKKLDFYKKVRLLNLSDYILKIAQDEEMKMAHRDLNRELFRLRAYADTGKKSIREQIIEFLEGRSEAVAKLKFTFDAIDRQPSQIEAIAGALNMSLEKVLAILAEEWDDDSLYKQMLELSDDFFYQQEAKLIRDYGNLENYFNSQLHKYKPIGEMSENLTFQESIEKGRAEVDRKALAFSLKWEQEMMSRYGSMEDGLRQLLLETKPKDTEILRSDEQLAQDKEQQQKDLQESPAIPTVASRTRGTLDLDVDTEMGEVSADTTQEVVDETVQDSVDTTAPAEETTQEVQQEVVPEVENAIESSGELDVSFEGSSSIQNRLGTFAINQDSSGQMKTEKFVRAMEIMAKHGWVFDINDDLMPIIKEGDLDFTKEELQAFAEYEGRSGKMEGSKLSSTEFYTPHEMAQIVWHNSLRWARHLSKKMGVDLKILANEPSAGSGRFIMRAPKEVKNIVVTDINGPNQVILKALYGDSIVFGSESGDYFESINKVDKQGKPILYTNIVGNPPYLSKDKEGSGKITGQASLQHNFINVAADQLAPNGVGTFIIQTTDVLYESNLKKFGDNVIIEEIVIYPDKAFAGFDRSTAMVTFRKRQPGEPIQDENFAGLYYNKDGSRRMNSMGQPLVVMAGKLVGSSAFQNKIIVEADESLKKYVDSLGIGDFKNIGGQRIGEIGRGKEANIAGDFERVEIKKIGRYPTSKHIYRTDSVAVAESSSSPQDADIKLIKSIKGINADTAYKALMEDGEFIGVDGGSWKVVSIDGDVVRIIKANRLVEKYSTTEIKEILANAKELEVRVDYNNLGRGNISAIDKAQYLIDKYRKYAPNMLNRVSIARIGTTNYNIGEDGGITKLMLSRDNIYNPETRAKEVALFEKFGGNVKFQEALGEIKGKIDLSTMEITADPNIEGVAYHEFGHLWELLLEKDSPIIHKEGIDLVKDSEYMNDSKLDIYKEHGISEDALAQEALAFAIQDAGLKFENMSKRAKFLHWLKRAFRNLTRKFGLTKMNLEDFVDQAVADINTGLEKKYKDAMKELQDALREGGINIDTELHLLQAEPEMTDEQLQEIKDKNEKKLKNRYGDRFSEIRHRYSKYFTKPDFYDVLSKILPIKKDAGFLIEKNAEYIGYMIEEHYKLVEEEEDGDQKINNGLEVAKELLEQNQYTFYADNVNVENLLDWNKYKDLFLDDYKEGEVICTMRDPDRGDAVFLMHIRHKNIENIPHANELTQDNLKDSPEWQSYLKRNDRYDKKTNTYNLTGLKPNINDPYSTSSMALQIPRKGQKAPTKLISRYNHTVGSPDAVYNLNFDRVAKGLSQAIYSATDRMDLITKNKKIYLNHSNTIRVKGSLYKYIQEYNSVYFGEGYLIVNEELRNTFDPGNYLAIDEGMGYLNKNTGELYFLNRDVEGEIDRNKVLENPMYAFIKNDGDRVEKVSNGVFKYISEGNRQMTYDINQKKLTIDDSKSEHVNNSDARLLTQALKIDHLEIIANGGVANLQKSGIDFYGLRDGNWSGVFLKSLTIKNATTLIGDDIGIDSVGILNLENVSSIGGYMFGDLISAGEIYAPNLLSIKGSINHNGPFFRLTKVDKASFPKLIEVQNDFLSRITDVSGVEFGDGVLRKVGNRFLREATQLGPKTYLNGLVEVGDNVLSNIDIGELSFPKLISVGNYFMSNGENIKKIDLPKLEIAGNNFCRNIKNIEKISLPNLKKVGNSALQYYPLSEITLPKLENVDGYFMSEAPNLKKANFPVLKGAGEGFMHTVQLEEFIAPKLKFMGDVSLVNSKLKDLDLPNLIGIGNWVFNVEHLVKVYLPSLKDAGNMFLGSKKEISTLKSVNLENLNYAGNFFLTNQVGLEEVNLPKLQYAGVEAFKKTGIKQLILPSLERAYSKFGAHSQLEYLDAPLLLSAEDNFLMGTEELRSVNLPSLKYLQHNAFNYSSVIELDLPKLTIIKAGSFQNMPRLSRAKFKSVREIESNVFKDTNATEIYMPNLKK